MKLIILDRDGVINQDSDHYVKSTDEWLPLPGSLQAIARLKQAGYTVAVATNQSGIARDMYDEDTLKSMHDKMQGLLAELGASVDYIAYCPHGPDDACDCRKPLAGLYKEIAAHFNCSLAGVPVVGDSLRDLQAAQSVHATPYLVRTGKGERTLAKGEGLAGIAVYDDLSAVAEKLLSED